MVNNNRLRSASLVTVGTSMNNLCTGGKRPILKPAVALMTMRGLLFAARIIGRDTPPKCKVINAVASKTRGSAFLMRSRAVSVPGSRARAKILFPVKSKFCVLKSPYSPGVLTKLKGGAAPVRVKMPMVKTSPPRTG